MVEGKERVSRDSLVINVSSEFLRFYRFSSHTTVMFIYSFIHSFILLHSLNIRDKHV